MGRAARGQSAEVRRPPVSDKVVQRVRDRLSYGAFDWAVTEEEALGALSDLARMPTSQRRSVLMSLQRDELLDRLFDNLPGAAFKSCKQQVLAVYAASPYSFLDARMEQLLNEGLIDSVSEDEAKQVLAMLAQLPQKTRDMFTYKDNGKWYRRLMDAIPPPPGQSKATAKGAGKGKKKSGDGGTEDEDKPGILDRTKAGFRAGTGLVGSGKVDLNDVEAVMGGDMGGVQLAEGGPGENQLDLNLDWDKGFLDAEIATLQLDAMQVGTGEGGTVSTGPGTLKGVHAQIKWSTSADPDSEMRFELDELTLNDIQVLMADITVVIGLVALSGLEVYAKKPPERTSPPTSKVGAIRLVAKQLEELIGTSLPGLASLGMVDPRDPSTLITRLKENFGGDLEFNLSLDGAKIKDVSTSEGDEMEELTLDALDVSVRQESRIQELELEHKDLELTLKEAGGDLGALTSEDHQRMAFISKEIERLKPLEQEQRRLAARFRAGTLTARQRDRLRELDNELTQGVAKIELDRMAASGITAQGHHMTQGEIEGLSARISGGSLNVHRETDRERLAKELGLPSPVKTAQTETENARAHIQVRKLAAQGVDGDDLSLAAGEVRGIDARIRNADDPESLKAQLAVEGASATELQTAQGSVGQADVKGLKASVDQKTKTAQATVGSAGASFLQVGDNSAEDVALSDLGVQLNNYDDAEQRSAKANLGSASVKGVRTARGDVDSASVKDVRAAAGPGLKEGQADVGSASVQGLRSEDYGLKSGKLQGVSASGNLADGSGAASLKSAEVDGLRVKDTTVGSGSISDVSATAGAGRDSLSASIGAADVKHVKRGDLSIEEAKLRGIKAGGEGLTDRDSRSLSAEMESASVFGAKKGDLSVKSAGLAGVKASSSRGEQDADLSVRGGVVTGLQSDNVNADKAEFRGLSAGVTDLGDSDKRKVDARLGRVGGEGIEWGQGDQRASAKSLEARDLGLTQGGGNVDVSANSLEGTGIGWQQGDDHKASADSLALQGIGVGVGDDKVAVDVDKLRGTGTSYAGGDTSVKAGELGLDGVGVRSGPDGLQVGTDKVHAGGVAATTKGGSAKMDSLDIGGVDLNSTEGRLKAGVSSVDARGISAKQGDTQASVAALRVGDVNADLDTEAGKLTSGGIGSVDVSGANYQQGDKRKASVNHLGVRDVSASDLSMGDGGPQGSVGVGQVLATGAFVKDGDRSASMGSATVDGLSAEMSGGQAQLGLDGAKVRDVRAQQGAKNKVNVGAVDLGSSQAAVGGLGKGGSPELLAARTAGLDVHGVKADVQPSTLAKAQTGGGARTGGANAHANAHANGNADAAADGKKKEAFRADALRGMTGHVNAVLPVTDPISTTVTIDIPVRNGLVNLEELEVDVTGLLAEIAIGDNPLQVTDDGGLLLDITGPWNVTLLEPGQAGLITEDQGGGDQGSIKLEDLVEGLMNAKVEKRGGADADVESKRKKKGKKKKDKKKKKDDKPPINLGKTEIHIGGLSAGDGRVGTSSAGITLDRDGDAGANSISVDGTLGDDVKVRADRLRGRDLDAGGAHADEVDVDGLKIDVNKPLDEQRSVRINVDRVGVGETTFGDQDALKKRDDDPQVRR